MTFYSSSLPFMESNEKNKKLRFFFVCCFRAKARERFIFLSLVLSSMFFILSIAAMSTHLHPLFLNVGVSLLTRVGVLFLAFSLAPSSLFSHSWIPEPWSWKFSLPFSFSPLFFFLFYISTITTSISVASLSPSQKEYFTLSLERSLELPRKDPGNCFSIF